LRGEDFDVVAEAGEGRPACTNVAVQAERFVLREDKDAAEIGVDAIGESDVNDAVESAKGNGGLGAIAGEGPKAFALATCEENSNSVTHRRHGWTPNESVLRSGSFYVTAGKSTSGIAVSEARDNAEG
jgi:hypothetical protein